jgi:ankyrin repeat protein
MSRVLPGNPSLEHLKKEAKVLLRAALHGDKAALERFQTVGRFSAAEAPALADAQHLLAREYGFSNWSLLKAAVVARAGGADPMTAFAEAIRDNDTAAAAAVLARHATLGARLSEAIPGGPFGGIAITMAASAGNRELMDLLLSAGANIDARTHWWAGGFSALDVSDRQTARFLLDRGAALTAVAAARLGMLDELQQLLDDDPARVAERGGDGQMPLHTAANVEIARLLLDRGANIDALDVDHESTPAMYHVRERTDVTRFLMSRGCMTDILMATAVGDADLVRSYLDRDPSSVRTVVSETFFPKLNPRAGGTIYNWTLGRNKSTHVVARDFGHPDIFNLLMTRTPDVLALAAAAETGEEHLVHQLLGRRPDLPSMLGDDEKLKLVTSAEANDRRAVNLMLSSGWPADARNASQTTALHWAGLHGNAQMVGDLLRHGAPVNAVDSTFNGTPLGWTLHGSLNGWFRRSGDYPLSAKMLLEAGAAIPSDPVASPEVLSVLAGRQK